MEIASNYAVSVAPPSYQVATEEAKRDTRLREQIPEPKQAERSAAQSRAADERGGTQSTAQTMAAQSQGLKQAEEKLSSLKDNERRQEQHLGKTGTEDSRRTQGQQGTTANEAQKAAAQQQARQAQSAQNTQSAQQAQILGQDAAGQSRQAAAASASGAVSGSSVLQETQLKDERRTDRKNRDEPAQFRALADEHNHTELSLMSKRNAAVAGRYNSIVPRDSTGRNLDIAI